MPRNYTPNEIVDILMILGESRRNYRQASVLYAQRYPMRIHPNPATIRKIENAARRRGIKYTRKRINLDDDDPRVTTVLAAIALNPHDSIRNIQRVTGIPRNTVHRILRIRKFHPYHITLCHELQPNDLERRMHFCRWAQARIEENPGYFNNIMFSDESTFHNTGLLNRHNCHYWAEENPHWYRQINQQHRWSVTVWCGILNGHLIGPYFFEGNVNQVNYLNLLQNELPSMLDEVDLQTRLTMMIQQDGAPPHYSRVVRQFLDMEYHNRWIGRGSGFQIWPPRSPDLTPLDFFLWGFVKNKVYEQAPTTRQDFMERIRNTCANIPRNILLATVSHFERRIHLCLQEQGAHFEHLNTARRRFENL